MAVRHQFKVLLAPKADRATASQPPVPHNDPIRDGAKDVT